MNTILTNAGKERLTESINAMLNQPGTINTGAICSLINSTLQTLPGISVGCRSIAWQAVDWITESTRRHVWLTALGSEGQTKAFRFRSLRIARVYAKRQLPAIVFCEAFFTPQAPAEFITVNLTLEDLQPCAT